MRLDFVERYHDPLPLLVTGPVYDANHRHRRRIEARRVATGTVRCARGADCRRAEDGQGGLIDPGEAWDLGHVDGDPTRYSGPEHAACNRATKSHQPPRRRPREPHPGLLAHGVGGAPLAADAEIPLA